MKNYRPRILQSDWSIASRHGRNIIYIYRLYFFLFFVVLYFIIAC